MKGFLYLVHFIFSPVTDMTVSGSGIISQQKGVARPEF